MSKYKQYEIEISPRLLSKLFDYVKANPAEDHQYIIDNLKWLSKSDEMLTLDEYDLAIRKSTSN